MSVRRISSILDVHAKKLTVAEKIELYSEKIPESGCWIWLASVREGGYGQFRGMNAHRASYIANKGEIQNNLHVLHRCDVRCCVNPNHLFLGTRQDNMSDMTRKCRQARGEEHGESVLMDNEVREIKSRLSRPYKRGYLVKLAKEFGISKQTLCKIKSGKNWKHI